MANLQAKLEDERLNQESTTAELEGQYLQSKAQHDADFQLAGEGLIDQVTLIKWGVAVGQDRKRIKLERAREEARKPSAEAQLTARMRGSSR